MQTPTYEERKAALIEEINTVFNGVSRDNGVSLHESVVIDNYGSMEERAEARKRDTETHWQDVPDKDLAWNELCLCFVDEIGFRYYVPAYMVWYLRYIDDDLRGFSSRSFSSLLYFLTPSDHEDLHEHDLAKMRLFTPEESKTIAHFLQFEQERQLVRMSEIEILARKEEEAEREEMRLEGISEAEIEAELREFGFKNEPESYPSQVALTRYWGQFL